MASVERDKRLRERGEGKPVDKVNSSNSDEGEVPTKDSSKHDAVKSRSGEKPRDERIRDEGRRGERRKLSSDGELSDDDSERERRMRRSRRRRRSSSSGDDSHPKDVMYPTGERYWGGGDARHRDGRDRGEPRRTAPRRNDDYRDMRRPRERENFDPNTSAKNPESVKDPELKIRPKKDEAVEALTTKTGGAYIPPAKLRMMQAQITDKESIAYQRIAWEALKKSINGLINKVNVANISVIVRELFRENLIRGRGVLARSIMQAQAASPTFTHVYASLVAIINSKFPQLGELILKRLIVQFRRGFRRNDKDICLAATRFIAHLVNQEVAHEIIALEILTLLLENATDHSLEVAIGFFKECGAKITEVSPRGTHVIFERLRGILHDGLVSTRVQYMIEVMFAIRKDGFKDHLSVMDELDLVNEQDKFTHLFSLEEVANAEEPLNVFQHDATYLANEEKYKTIRKEILSEESSASEGSDGDGSGKSDDEEEDDEDNEEKEGGEIVDNTETNLISLRRVIYLTIQSSLDFEECAHKMLKMELKPGQEGELCHMILDCCAQQRTYEKFYGLLAQRFCQLNKIYVEPFEGIFRDTYDTIHRLETNKLRNVSKLFAHLLFTDAINWTVLGHIKLNEEDTTSSSRIFIKVLFQELSEYMGLAKLNGRVKDPTLQDAFAGLFPRDNPCNTRFAINFFTSIGLGGLTDELREHLKSQPKPSATMAAPPVNLVSSSSSASPSLASSSSSSSSSSESSEEESSSSNDRRKRRKKKDKQRRK